MTGPYVLFQLPAESDTVHDRHHNIADYDIRDAAKSLLLSFFSIVGGEYFERICEGLGDIFLYLFIVFYNQQDRFAGIQCGFLWIFKACFLIRILLNRFCRICV